MKHNLNDEIFQNGEVIPHAKKGKDWELAGRRGKPVWCFYDNNPTNGNVSVSVSFPIIQQFKNRIKLVRGGKRTRMF
jgi:hypothetical protein